MVPWSPLPPHRKRLCAVHPRVGLIPPSFQRRSVSLSSPWPLASEPAWRAPPSLPHPSPRRPRMPPGSPSTLGSGWGAAHATVVDLSHEPQPLAVRQPHVDQRGVYAALPNPRACLGQGASLHERDAESFIAQ